MEAAEEALQSLVDRSLEALKLLERLTGAQIPRESLNRAVYSALSTLLYELCHASIRELYAGLEAVREIDRYLALCIEEVGARLLEAYVAASIGVPAISFEEHSYELNMVPVFRGRVTPRLLERLYREMVEAIERGRLRAFVTGELRDTCRRIAMAGGGPRLAIR